MTRTVLQRYRRLTLPVLPIIPLASQSETVARIRRNATLFESPFACIGLEQTVQALIEERWPDRTTRKPFYRLAPEPALLGFWGAIGTPSFVDENLLDFVAVIRGAEAEVRQGEVCSGGDGDDGVLFERADFGRWADGVKSTYALALPPLIEAIAIYAQTVFAHPFRDGNGRLARALIYGSLRRGGLISSPCLGLGPTFDLCRRSLASATLALSERSDWVRYADILGKVLSLSATHASQAMAVRVPAALNPKVDRKLLREI